MKIKFLLISILLLACTSSPTIEEQNVSVMQQLEADYKKGRISDDEYYTYLTYSVFAQELLPEKYNAPMRSHDATPAIRKVQKAYPTLSKATQEHIKQWIKSLPPKPKKPGVRP